MLSLPPLWAQGPPMKGQSKSKAGVQNASRAALSAGSRRGGGKAGNVPPLFSSLPPRKRPHHPSTPLSILGLHALHFLCSFWRRAGKPRSVAGNTVHVAGCAVLYTFFSYSLNPLFLGSKDHWQPSFCLNKQEDRGQWPEAAPQSPSSAPQEFRELG